MYTHTHTDQGIPALKPLPPILDIPFWGCLRVHNSIKTKQLKKINPPGVTRVPPLYQQNL